MNAKAAQTVGFDKSVEVFARSKVVDLPENVPSQAFAGSSIFLRGLLQRQKQIIYRMDVLRYTMSDETSRGACMAVMAFHGRLLQEQTRLLNVILGLEDLIEKAAARAASAPSNQSGHVIASARASARAHTRSGTDSGYREDTASSAFSDSGPV